MRRLFTTEEALGRMSRAALRWGARSGRWRRVVHGVYAVGPEAPTEVDRARARVLAARTVSRGGLAGVLFGLDAVVLDHRPTRTRALPDDRVVVVDGLRCADGLQTMIDLAATLDDDTWEQALESALRQRLTTIAALELALPELQRARTPGVIRIRRVLARRPADAPPTESLLETLMVQLARTVPGLGDPVRQYEVYDAAGRFVARVDLAWPELGLFIELDGQHHLGQPVHDARRETAIVAATGWLCGRFTWTEVTRVPVTTARRLGEIADQAARRRFAA